MLDFLKEEAKKMAKKSAATLEEVSMIKDWGFLKTGKQIYLNKENGLRKLALSQGKKKIEKGLKGKSGQAIQKEVQRIKEKSYYVKGADKIR